MKKVLNYLAYPEEYLQRINDCFKNYNYEVLSISPKDPEGKDKAIAAIQDVDVALIGSPIPRKNLEESNAKWIHIDWVGVEGVLSNELLKNHIVTNGSGRNSICLAEHVFFFAMFLEYGTREIIEAQKNHQWGVTHKNPYESLFSRTMLIAGTGSIAQEVAKRAKGFDMKTIGYSRSIKENLENFDEQYAQGDIAFAELAKRADYVVNCLPLNKDTYHLIDANVLNSMKKTAYLINISRGNIIDEDALAEALKNNTIAGAASDTFAKEPLDPSSPLWDLDNMIITPHHTPQSPLKFEKGVETVTTNLKLFEEGKRLVNLQSEKDVLA